MGNELARQALIADHLHRCWPPAPRAIESVRKRAAFVEVQEKSARLHLTAVMVIHHRTVIAQWATRRNETDGQFGKIVVTIQPERDLWTQRRTPDEDRRY